MNSRESFLLRLFGGLLFAVVLFFGVRAGLSRWMSLREGTVRMRGEVETLQSLLNDRVRLEGQHEWVEAHLPRHASRQEASAGLLALVEAAANGSSVKLAKRELIAPGSPGESDDSDASAYFDQTTVQVAVDASEQDVVDWLHRVQSPEHFCGVTRLVLEPPTDPASAALHCEAEITLYYRVESPAREPAVPDLVKPQLAQEAGN